MGDVSGAAGAREVDVAVIAALRSEAERVAAMLQQRAEDLSRHQVGPIILP